MVSLLSQRGPTEAEMQMLRLLAAGHGQKESALLLGLKHTAGRNRLDRLKERIGVETVSQLLIVAGARGWVTVECHP